jgi:hypothetical protein
MDPKTGWKYFNTSIHVFIHIYWISASIFNKGRQPTNPQKLKLNNSYIMKILPIIGKLKVYRTYNFVFFFTYFLRFPSVKGPLSLQFPCYHHTPGPLLSGALVLFPCTQKPHLSQICVFYILDNNTWVLVSEMLNNLK